MTSSDDAPTLSLLDYVRPVLARWWLVVLVVAVATAGTYAFYERQAKVYTASTRLYTSLDSASPTQIDGGTGTILQQEVLNASALLTSRATGAAVARRLRFRDTPSGIAGSLTATTTEMSTFITITATRNDPRQASDLANTVASYYIESRSGAARRRLQRFLRQQQDQLREIPVRASTLESRTTLATSIRETRLAISSPQTRTVQLDPATPPGAPESPRPRRNALFALVLSLFVAIGLAFALERFDRRLKRVEDVEGAYGVPMLAVLPHAKDPVDFGSAGKAEVAPEFLEAFRQLRTNIQLGSLERPLRRILVTSAVPGEGKSTVARNLAMSYREFGRSVVVVDADLRKPTQGTLFGVESTTGLTAVLTGEAPISEALVDVPVELRGMDTLARIEAASDAPTGGPLEMATRKISGVGVLLSGGRTANPQAVLASGAMGALLKQLEELADVVIIDSPPVLAVSDALALAGGADAIVLVSRMGLSTRDGAKRSMETLRRVHDVRIAGVIVNDLAGVDKSHYGYADYGSKGTGA